MANSSAVQLERKYLQNPQTEEEVDSSDDSEVSVANMNRHRSNEVFAEENGKEDNEEYSITNVEVESEIVSDDEYAYSEDSLCSDDSCRDSDMTNVTPRSSASAGSPLNRTMTLDFPIRRRLQEIARAESTPRKERLDNTRENIRRMCSSANDNRFSIANEPRNDTVNARARRNMSFTNAEMRKIELENQYLLKKIMAHQKPQNKPLRVQSAQPRVSSSAINRRKLQKKIEDENMMLLRRIQEAKSCAFSTNSIPGYRLTSL